MLGWWWNQICGAYSCSVCGRTIHDGENYYTPRNPDDEQVVLIERLFRVDGFVEFAVCEACMGFVEFSTWLDWQLEEYNEKEKAASRGDWKKYGF